MKTATGIVICVILLFLNASYSSRCKRQARDQCTVNNTATGLLENQEFNPCTEICCGRNLEERNGSLSCCGDKTAGMIYNTKTQTCCTWQFGNQFAVYDNDNLTPNTYCCGSIAVQPQVTTDQSCCSGYQIEPQLFNHRTEMCCNGNKQFAGNTAYSSCCGDNSYDRRVSSCPCGNGVVGVRISEAQAGCCNSNDGRTRTPYNKDTEICCNGAGYDKGTYFCCGGQPGFNVNQTCCGNAITARTDNLNISSVSCCILADGSPQEYNVATSICCGGVVHTRNTSIENQTICCGGILYNIAQFGDTCCGNNPYSSLTDVCCNGVVGTGNACCNGQPYSTSDQICCGETASAHDFKSPSCCSTQPFDSYNSTCCGLTIFENPIIATGNTTFEVSHTTRCCGDTRDSDSLAPYDYFTQTCCGGEVVDLNGASLDTVQCCGTDIIVNQASLCCNDKSVEKIFGDSTGCCEDVAMNTTAEMCCNGVPVDLDSVTGKPACCDTILINSEEQKCCNGIPRSLNGIAPENAICCGNGCIDGTLFWCCNGRQYRKGAQNGVVVTGLQCTDLFG